MAVRVTDQEIPRSAWLTSLDPREQAQIDHARNYRANYTHAGAPGHGQFILIAKLADMLDAAAAAGQE